jgi:threonine dehydratase
MATALLPRDPDPAHRIALAAIAEAPSRIPPEFRDSPQYECEPLSAALGCHVTIKVETANPIRSFKGRGASVLVSRLVEAAGSAPRTPLVGASAGNWGQALAYACRAARWPLVLFAAETANPLKVERMRALGAEVRLSGVDFDAAKEAAAAFAAAQGWRMVADGLDVEASIGAGTIGTELLARGDAFDAVLVPLGNGALLTGVGRWVKAAAPGTRVIGVQAEGADAMTRSWRSGQLVFPPSIDTIADGIGVRVPIAEAVADMRTTVDDVRLVRDADLVQAMQLLHRHAGLVVEPSGAAGLAALAAHPDAYAGQRVATILCGGNLTDAQVAKWLRPTPTQSSPAASN